MHQVGQAINTKIQGAVLGYLQALVERTAVTRFTSLHQFPQGANLNLNDGSKITLFVNKKITEKTTGFTFAFTGIVREFKNAESVYHHLNVNWGLSGIAALENIYDIEVFCKYHNLFQSIKIKSDFSVRRTIYQPVTPGVTLRRTASVYDKIAIKANNYHHIIAHDLEEDLWLVHYANFSDSELKRYELLLQNFPYTYGSEFGRVNKSEEELNIYTQLLKFVVSFPEWRWVKIKYQSDIERYINKEIIDLYLRRARLTHKTPEVVLQKILTSINLDFPGKIVIPGGRVEKEVAIDLKTRYAEILRSVSSYIGAEGLVDMKKEIFYTKTSLPMQEEKEEKIGEPSQYPSDVAKPPVAGGLEKTLINQWQEKSEEKPLESSKEPPKVEMLPQERGRIESLQQEEPNILSEIMAEKETPPPEVPPEPPQARPLPSGELVKPPSKLPRLLLNIFIFLLVVSAAAFAGYMYTSKTGSGLPKLRKIPIRLPLTSEEALPPPEEPVPKLPLETTTSSEVPAAPPEATPSITPVTAWGRHRNEDQRYFFVAPQEWLVKLGSAPDAVTTVSTESRDLLFEIKLETKGVNTEALRPQSFGEVTYFVEESSESLIYYTARGDEFFSIEVSPREYNQAYRDVLETILSRFKFFTPVEDAVTQEYTNSIDNYTMKYPAAWVDKGLATSEFGLSKNFSSAEASGRQAVQKGEIWLSLGYLDKANLETYRGNQADNQYFSYLKDKPQGQTRKIDPEYAVTKFKDISVSGLPAVQQAEEKATEYAVSIYVLNGTKVFQISATSADEGNFLNFEKVIDKIVASFSFK